MKLLKMAHQPNPRRATSWGGADNQVPAEQPREAEWTTKSLSSNPTRRIGRPSPCRAISWDRANDQVTAEQPGEAERTTKSHVNLTSVREWPTQCVREWPTQCCWPVSAWQDTSSPTHARASRRIHSGTVSKDPYWMWTLHRHILSQAIPNWCMGPINLGHRDLSDRFSRMARIPERTQWIHRTGCIPTQADKWNKPMTIDEAPLCATAP